MEKNEIEKLIGEEITKAKLLIVEKRLGYVLLLAGGLLAFFGVIYPFLQTQQSTKKVDDAIEKMEDRFNELAGMQLRKPDIECFYNGKTLDGANIDFKTEAMQVFRLRNSGDRTADISSVELYIKPHMPASISGSHYMTYGSWDESVLIGEEGFDDAYFYTLGRSIVDAGRTIPIAISLINIERTQNCKALLLIFYGQEEPSRYEFNLVFIE